MRRTRGALSVLSLSLFPSMATTSPVRRLRGHKLCLSSGSGSRSSGCCCRGVEDNNVIITAEQAEAVRRRRRALCSEGIVRR